MGGKTKRFTIILIIVFFSLMLVFPASAADSNDDIVNAGEDILTADESSTETNKIDVELTTTDQYGIYGNSDTQLIATAVDEDGNKVTEGSVLFIDVFGKNYTAELKKNGNWESEVFVGETGQFNITCQYIGTDTYNNAETTFLLTPAANTTCHNVVATRYGDTVYFTGNVVSDYTQYEPYNDFEEVTQGNVTVYVDGEKLGSCDLDINGNYVYIWKTKRNLIGQTINFTGVYTDKDKHFNPSTFSKSFTFEAPKDTKIISHVTDMDNNEKMVTGTVVDENGDPVIGGTITVNGKYEVPVDTYGKFKFYITDKTPEKTKYEIGVFDWGSKADIRVNEPLMAAIEHTEVVDQLIDLCQQGTPYIKFGNGNGKTVVVNVGTHGGELASQVAGFKLINLLVEYGGEINGTIYVIPTIFPEATANNTRIYNGTNLNTVADKDGTLSNHVVKFAESIKADGLGDFHNTRHGDNDVGVTCVMGSWNPTPESDEIAKFIAAETGYTLDDYPQAGDPYAGAIEDYANLQGIPSVTCESLTNHRAVEYGTPEMSFNEMRAFLRYFGFDTDEMIHINLNGLDELILEFASPYNYNPSSVNITLNDTVPENNSDIPTVNKVASAGEKTLPATGNPIAMALLAILAIGTMGLKRKL